MRKLLLLFINALLSIITFGQQPFHRDYWLNESRTPLSANCLLQDSSGYIFIGTDEGLLRFNGYRFTKISSFNNAPVTAMVKASQGIIVTYSNGEIGTVHQDTVQQFFLEKTFSNTKINAVIANKNELWLSTDQGICAINNKKKTIYTTQHGLSDDYIYSMHFIDPQRLLAATDHGINDVHIIQDKISVKTFTSKNGLPDNIVTAIAPAYKTSLFWGGTQQKGLVLYDAAAQKLLPIQSATPWQWGQINALLPIDAHHVWAATEQGFLVQVVLTDNALSYHPYAFTNRKLKALLLDYSGNIWVGTDKGLTLFTPEYLWQISINAPYRLRDITTLCFDKENTCWLALSNKLYTVETTGSLNAEKQFASTISCLYCDNHNRLWIGTMGDGLWCKLNGENQLKKVPLKTLNQQSILSITTSTDKLWVAGLNGVEEIALPASNNLDEVNDIKQHTKASGVGTDYIYQLFTDTKDRIWMATDGAGVCMYDGKQYFHWDIFNTKDNNVAYSVAQDMTGNIWSGTLYKDLYRYKNEKWENIRNNETQDVDVNVFTVNTNRTGQVVAVFQRCIDVWYPESSLFRHFNSRLNMGFDSTSTVLNCSAKDTAGNVYIPFEKGLLLFKNLRKQWDIKPRVVLTGVENDFKKTTQQQPIFKANTNFISFHFDGISFTNPERLNYRYRLEGYSQNWIHTNETEVTFPKLPPGNYVFQVQVSLNADFSTAQEARFAFKIATPIWQRGWFVASFLLLVGGIVFLLIRQRDKRNKRLAQLKQERILFEYEHLKTQVNPHFLFNSLNTLTSLIEQDPESAVTYTEQLSDLYRNLLSYKGNDWVTLEEEWSFLANYLYIQESRFGSALQVVKNIPKALMKSKKIVPLSLQLLVENAIKHNVVSMASPLVVKFEIQNDTLVVSNTIQPKLSKEKESGLGLANIQKRYALLSDKPIRFGKNDGVWEVRLPLL